MKIASVVATTSFTLYLNNRQYYQFLHRQAPSLLAVSMTKMGGEENACLSDDCSCDHDHDDDTSSIAGATTMKVTGNEIEFVDKIQELARIIEDDVQLVVWEQREQPSFIKVITHITCSMSLFFSPHTLKSLLLVRLRHSTIHQYLQRIYHPSKGWCQHYLS